MKKLSSILVAVMAYCITSAQPNRVPPEEQLPPDFKPASTNYIGPNTHEIVHNAKTPVLVINKVNVYALTGSR